jgi:hypothetical protein
MNLAQTTKSMLKIGQFATTSEQAGMKVIMA